MKASVWLEIEKKNNIWVKILGQSLKFPAFSALFNVFPLF